MLQRSMAWVESNSLYPLLVNDCGVFSLSMWPVPLSSPSPPAYLLMPQPQLVAEPPNNSVVGVM